MRGSKTLSNSDDSSRQGFVLTSMSQTLYSESIMKSYPKISKQYLRSFALSLYFT